METRRLKRDVEALLGEYIGRRLRENNFDPMGKGSSTVLDELAHYDLAINVALWWLDKDDEQDLMETDLRGLGSPGDDQYPNRLEREAMILSSFAGMLLNKLPVKEILSLYSSKPSASYFHQHTKSAIVHPFSLSYHPFAMLHSFKAVDHSKRHTKKLKRWSSQHRKAGDTVDSVGCETVQSCSSSSHSTFTASGNSLKEQMEHDEGSQESLHSPR
ncbi:uncharacterized protein C2orf80 [Chanos chanos]|uniref:Uncharacterized protein C2orf80 n=1 Tax=Chanos chanos TaxID=29144 RepID=A0A6J2WGM5_CHACN|nr:uncharacterized protein C2orf80 homolog [Chanos chanos]